MTTPWARGKYAHGFCDRCGFRYPLHALKAEYQRQNPTGLRTCPECFDKDHPQNSLGLNVVQDPQALFNPRPDLSLEESRRLFSWDPVGHASLQAIAGVGAVNIVTG